MDKTELNIELCARFFAKAYITGFRSSQLKRVDVLSVEDWVNANWVSFSSEAYDLLESLK